MKLFFACVCLTIVAIVCAIISASNNSGVGANGYRPVSSDSPQRSSDSCGTGDTCRLSSADSDDKIPVFTSVKAMDTFTGTIGAIDKQERDRTLLKMLVLRDVVMAHEGDRMFIKYVSPLGTRMIGRMETGELAGQEVFIYSKLARLVR